MRCPQHGVDARVVALVYLFRRLTAAHVSSAFRRSNSLSASLIRSEAGEGFGFGLGEGGGFDPEFFTDDIAKTLLNIGTGAGSAEFWVVLKFVTRDATPSPPP
jgi:hypothetical protein